MSIKDIIKNGAELLLILGVLVIPALADTNITSGKDLLGNPITTFNGLPESTKSGILLVTGLVFLGALICVIYGIATAVGKTTTGSSSQDAKMRNEGVTGLLTLMSRYPLG